MSVVNCNNLPSGWQAFRTVDGKSYFLAPDGHTTWRDPRVPTSPRRRHSHLNPRRFINDLATSVSPKTKKRKGKRPHRYDAKSFEIERGQSQVEEEKMSTGRVKEQAMQNTELAQETGKKKPRNPGAVWPLEQGHTTKQEVSEHTLRAMASSLTQAGTENPTTGRFDRLAFLDELSGYRSGSTGPRVEHGCPKVPGVEPGTCHGGYRKNFASPDVALHRFPGGKRAPVVTTEGLAGEGEEEKERRGADREERQSPGNMTSRGRGGEGRRANEPDVADRAWHEHRVDALMREVAARHGLPLPPSVNEKTIEVNGIFWDHLRTCRCDAFDICVLFSVFSITLALLALLLAWIASQRGDDNGR